MGQQQLLLIILGVIIVGVAIAVGISLFTGQSNQGNRDNIIADINNMAADAFQYRFRPVSMGGGGASYANYHIPSEWGANNPNATYTVSGTPTATSISFHAVSKTVSTGVVDETFDGSGQSVGPTFSGF
ncbi:MAG TPA: hypothetical protein VKS81_02350 [Bacteroidota bacterium]|nr:hypothetical protein [Bacteroidota bacterium]